ncbi:MAG: class C beta-lactamase-related serine hydrolase [Verrucomicrobiaceae bacterium]|nr:MAG: class C beta-lactamase-related serine hydrolase [Verrucomicrobiaceae bacterium]
MMSRLFSAACLLAASLATSQAANPLPRGTPEAQGIPTAAIAEYVGALDKIETMHSFMILRHGQVIAEGWWKPEAADKQHVLNSVSKSFNSTAVGLAVAEGKLSLDDKVLKFFPDDAPADPSENLRAMTVRDLLTMSGGHDTEPKKGADGAPSVKLFLNAPVVHPPGTHFLYNGMGSYTLSAIVTKATGQTVEQYLKPRLFDPLGIENAKWPSSPEGFSLGAHGLYLLTEDIAKLGQLYLQKGKWNGKQLLTEAWVADATRKHVPNNKEPHANIGADWHEGYGYQFWRCRHNAYRADGAGGQFVVVIPDKDVVIAMTAGGADMQAELDVIWEKLLPAFQDNALPADPAAQEKLKQTIGTLEVRPAKKK